MSQVRGRLTQLLITAGCLLGTQLFAGFNFSSRESRIKVVDPSANFVVNTAITGYDGTLELIDNSANRVQGQTITFNKGALESGTLQAFFTGVYDPTSTDIIKLQGSHRLRCAPGTVLPAIQVSGAGNKIEGAPLFTGSITLSDTNANLSFALQNKLNQSVLMNGGTISLDDNLSLAEGVSLGSTTTYDYGAITFNGKTLSMPGRESTWTGTLFINNASSLELNSLVHLQGTWIFGPENGVSILNGNGNILDMTTCGTIWVRSNHTLVVNNVIFKGLGGQSNGWLLMEDSNSTMSLVGCTFVLNQSYTLTQGVLYYYGSNSSIITGDKLFIAAQNGKIKIDGVSLGYDPLTTPDINNVRPIAPDNVNLFSVNNGILRNNASGIADLYLDLGTNTMLSNEVFGPNRKMYFNGAFAGSTVHLDGNGFAVDFARVATPMVIVTAGKSASLSNIVLRNFSPSTVLLGSGSTLVFKDKVTIELSQAEDLSSTWSFVEGTSTIRGQGCALNLVDGIQHSIVVFPNTTLKINDIIMTSLSGSAVQDVWGNYTSTGAYIRSSNKLRCLDNSSKIELRNSEIALNGNFTFTVGQIDIYNDVTVRGDGRIFNYTSPDLLTIKSDSTLTFDRNINFSYESVASTYATSRNRIAMTSATSRLFLNGCTLHTTWTGVKLQTGTLVINDKVSIESEGRDVSEGIVFDSGLKVEVLAGATLDLDGYLIYQ